MPDRLPDRGPITISIDPAEVNAGFVWERFVFHLDTHTGETRYNMTVRGEYEAATEPEGERWKITMTLPSGQNVTRIADFPSYLAVIEFTSRYGTAILANYAAAEDARRHFNTAVAGWATERYEALGDLDLAEAAGAALGDVILKRLGSSFRDFLVDPFPTPAEPVEGEGN